MIGCQVAMSSIVVMQRLEMMLKLNSCWNSIYRKIFGYFKWESVKEIQLFCQRLDFIRVVDKCKFSFFKQLVYELFEQYTV